MVQDRNDVMIFFIQQMRRWKLEVRQGAVDAVVPVVDQCRRRILEGRERKGKGKGGGGGMMAVRRGEG